MEQKPNKFEVLLWSIFLPGLGQILNQKLVKGFVLVILVIIVNYKSKLNLVIFSSFNGELSKAILMTDYQWLLFCPCLYMFAIWDAYKEAEGEVSVLGYIPFVMTAYFAVVGLIFFLNFRSIWEDIRAIIHDNTVCYNRYPDGINGKKNCNKYNS
ncbi:hypothetical protein [Piscibacillus halophilus]|uniref:Uncharacterized protein n=1 Tax=Piscibacillus halophilus TaxID=571933 RepID=A0A1H9IKN9_9BACI|nr:hypothetical protein [Piscibacillus halophilus]SEQ75173.1 hypothetical protein SAMN05216362_12532 [Piscibacillus halophilus]